MKKKLNKGKLIVIDGIDGSGKATQTSLLKKRLQKEGFKVKTIDFPHYYGNFFGQFIGECLAGKYGDFIKVNSKIASVLYAADRFESSGVMHKWIEDGYIVITDRYVSANQIHQGGKIKNSTERKEFIKWLDVMEHKVFKIPKPDLIIYLDVPYEISSSWLKNKITQRSKKYLNGKKDVAEDNLAHLKISRSTALELEKVNKNWEKISCCTKNICLPPEGVHEEVYKVIKNRLPKIFK